MKKIQLLCVLLLSGFAVSALHAETNLDSAFGQFKSNGIVPFVNSLYQDPDNAQRVIKRLSPLLEGTGEFYSYEVISRRFITKKIERVILVLYFEKFPIYMRLDLYDTPRGKVWLPAQVSKEATDVLPLEIISTSGK